MNCSDEYHAALENCGADLIKLKRLFRLLENAEGDWTGKARWQVAHRMRTARTTLPLADGRPLYAYQLQHEQFDYWQKSLTKQVASGKSPHAGAFVLWAAEWFRRCYRGDGIKWDALGEPLSLDLTQAGWRNLADKGLEYWGLPPVVVNGTNYRLVAIARQAGFPVAALSDGQGGWAESYLAGLVGQLLGAAVIREDTAISIAENLSDRVPVSWRNAEMQAVCAELASVVVSLRQEADKGGAGSAVLVSSWLTQNRPNWRDTLPLRMEGQASALIDKLLTAKAIPSAGGSVRVRRFVDLSDTGVRQGLVLDLNGSLKLRQKQQAAVDADGNIARLRLFAAGELAQTVTGELAMLDEPVRPSDGWRSRLTHRTTQHDYGFEKPVSVELRADGQLIGAPFELRGGEPVNDGLRIYELDQDTTSDEGRLWLRSWSSGAFKAYKLIVELPDEWLCVEDAAQDKEQNAVWKRITGRTFWQVTSPFIAENPQGDRYLIRPGQDAAHRDGLHLDGRHVNGVQTGTGLQLIAGRPTVQLTESGRMRAIGEEKIGWRQCGERDWQSCAQPAPFGMIEYGWRDGSTGHLRAKSIAMLLPENFAVNIQKNGSVLNLQLLNWAGHAKLSNSIESEPNNWRINLANMERDRVDLVLSGDGSTDIHLEVPLPIVSWIAKQDGYLLPRNSVISLATLNRYIARNDRFTLIGEVLSARRSPRRNAGMHRGIGVKAGVGRIWRGSNDMSLSVIRDDIARMIRPLGIDYTVQLNFNDSLPNQWYVQEFETEIEERDIRGWFPVSSCGEDKLMVCGRKMSDPAREHQFGEYTLADTVNMAPLPIPRLREPWIIYLATDDRVLSRPIVIGTAALNPQAHNRLGLAMALPYEELDAALSCFIQSILDDPSSKSAQKDIRSVIDLAYSLGGLPPMTFRIFALMNEKPEFGPHLLMHAGEKELASIVALADGLLFDWATVPQGSWQTARDAAGYYYMSNLPEMTGQSQMGRSKMILDLLHQQQTAIVDALPWLESVLLNDVKDVSFDDICDRLFGRLRDGIDQDRDNPFRPDLDVHHIDRRLSPSLARICDAPVAAAFSADGKLELTKAQIMTLKDVRENHPQFFGEAYAFALANLTGE